MFYSDIIRRVRNAAGDINVLQFTDAMLTDWINDAVRECAIQNTLLQKTATQNTVVGQQEYNLPTDILKLHSIHVNGEKMKIMTQQEWEELSGGQPAGTVGNSIPFQVFVWATKVNLYPPPSSVVPLKIMYIYDPPDWNGTNPTTTIPPLPNAYHHRLVPYCLAQVAQQDENQALYTNLMIQFQSGVIDLTVLHQEEEDLYPSIAVSSRDMGSYPSLEF